MSFDADTAIRFAQALEPLRLRWFEDPVPILNFDSVVAGQVEVGVGVEEHLGG